MVFTSIRSNAKYLITAIFSLTLIFSSFTPSYAASAAVDDDMYLTYKTTDTVNLLSNDTIDADYESYEVVVQPTKGILTTYPNGNVMYYPVPGTYGYDQFEYILKDEEGTEVARATVFVTVISPWTSREYIDIYVYKTDHDVTAEPGQVVTYTLVYDNLGTITAQNAFIRETLPPYTTFNAAGSTGVWDCVANTCTHNLGDILPGDPANSVSFSYTINSDIPTSETEVLNTAFIGVRNEFSPDYPLFGDTNPDSNTSIDTTPITFPEIIDEEEEEEIIEEETEEESEEENGDVLGASTDNEVSTTTEGGSVLGAATLADTGLNVNYVVALLMIAIVSSSTGLVVLTKKK